MLSATLQVSVFLLGEFCLLEPLVGCMTAWTKGIHAIDLPTSLASGATPDKPTLVLLGTQSCEIINDHHPAAPFSAFDEASGLFPCNSNAVSSGSRSCCFSARFALNMNWKPLGCIPNTLFHPLHAHLIDKSILASKVYSNLRFLSHPDQSFTSQGKARACTSNVSCELNCELVFFNPAIARHNFPPSHGVGFSLGLPYAEHAQSHIKIYENPLQATKERYERCPPTIFLPCLPSRMDHKVFLSFPAKLEHRETLQYLHGKITKVLRPLHFHCP